MQQTLKLNLKQVRQHAARNLVENAGKLPPQVTDLERVVLGAILLEKEALNAVIEFLRPNHFYVDAHSAIYESILDLFQEGKPIDIKTVHYQIKKKGHEARVGGAYFLAELTAEVASSANIQYCARQICEVAIKRTLLTISSEIQQDAFDETQDVFEILDKAERKLFGVYDANLKGNYSDIKSLLYKTIQNLQNLKQQNFNGIPSGFLNLDQLTSGWQNSDLVIIAARPGMGKSSFILTALRNAAVDYKIPVAIFSLEMANVQLTTRLISMEAEIESERVKNGTLSAHEWQALVHKSNELSNAPLYLDDTPALSIMELRAKCRRLKAEHNIKLIAVDYLQLMKGENSGNREQEISSISRSLKSIAKELDIPVLALSQLSRSVETRGGNKKPQLSDLRESGSIEQDADIVLFLYRPEYYKIAIDEDGSPTDNVAEIIIAKHRNGPVGTAKIKFISQFTKFTNFEQVTSVEIDGQSI